MSTSAAGIAVGESSEIRYIAETVEGTTPGSPQTKILRTTSRDINLKRKTLESQEIRATRQVKDVRLGMYSVEGKLGAEVSLIAYDDFIAANLGGTWTAVTIAATPALAAVASGTHITRSTGSWITDDFRPGDIVVITLASNAANNGAFRVTAVTGTNLTLLNPEMVDEAAATLVVAWPGKRCDVGALMQTFTIERAFKDVTKFEAFLGCCINTWDNKIQPEQMVTSDFGILGLTATPTSGTPLTVTPTAAPTHSPMSSFDGNIFEGGAANAVITGLDFSTTNGRKLDGVVGSKVSPQIFEGRFRVTGTLSAFFQDEVLQNKFINETLSSAWVKLDDLNGTDFLNFVFPSIKYTGNDKNPPAEGGVVQSMPFMALEDSVYGKSMWVQRSNAS